MARRRKSSASKRKLTPSKGGRAHPGFAKAAASIARRQGVSPMRARAILAAGARRAGPAARKKNPRLKRVSGVPGYKPARRRRGK